MYGHCILAIVSDAFPGMMVTSTVKLVRPLGEGGMGSVWVAEHLALRTEVVVKFIAQSLQGNREAHDRFSREAAAAAQVKSPHVVQTFDHGVTEQGVPYIVMELLEGRDLGACLAERVVLAPGTVVEMVTQLARALDRAHERGIVHRDIKPDNVFLCDLRDSASDCDMFVKLLDFGIAKGMQTPKLDSGTKTGAMIGSPFYMSPEQITGSKDIDHRSDLWSVGVLAFEALTGTRPFEADTVGGLAIQIYSAPMPVPSERSPELPAEFDGWFSRACAREIDKRFRSAREMAEELAFAFGAPRSKSLGAAPRSVARTGAVSGHAATLPSGAATDAGVVRATTQYSPRGRFVAIALLAVVVPVLGYAAFRATRTPAPAPAAAASPSQPTVAAVTAVTSAPPAATSSAPPVDPIAPVAPATASPSTKTKAHARAPRAKEPAATPQSTPSPAPQPPQPAGHDIF